MFYMKYIYCIFERIVRQNGIHTNDKMGYIMYAKERVFFMGTFKIPTAPTSTQKTIRFPDELIAKVENAIKGKDCTFSAFVVEATRSALEQLD